MATTVNNFKLGLFVLGGLALLLVGILALGASAWFEPMSTYETYIPGEVTGLAIGSVVELRGVRVGRVTRIDFSWNEYGETDPSYIIVDFAVRNGAVPRVPGKESSQLLQAAVKRGFRARLQSQGITGTSILSLEYLDPVRNPPLQVPWTPKHVYIPSAPSEFGELLASIEHSLHNFERLDFTTISQLVQGDLVSAGKVLDRLNEADVGALSANANSLLTDLRGQSQNLTQNLNILLGHLNGVAKNANGLVRSADGLVGSVRETVMRLEPGLAGIDFDALNQTLSNTRRASGDLDDVLAELKQYPAGFIFGSPPAPVNAVRPSPKK
jgi:ABC-type transporter Mla subunit MlaD